MCPPCTLCAPSMHPPHDPHVLSKCPPHGLLHTLCTPSVHLAITLNTSLYPLCTLHASCTCPPCTLQVPFTRPSVHPLHAICLPSTHIATTLHTLHAPSNCSESLHVPYVYPLYPPCILHMPSMYPPSAIHKAFCAPSACHLFTIHTHSNHSAHPPCT